MQNKNNMSRDELSGKKIIQADQLGKIKLHLTKPNQSDNSQDLIAEDVTPRTGFFMKLYNQTQPLVRAYQLFTDGNLMKAKRLLKSPQKADEMLLLGMLHWQSGEIERAEENFREAFLNKSEIGFHFRRYGIQLSLEVETNPENTVECNYVFHMFAGVSLFTILYACICNEMGKEFIGFQQLKSYVLLHPEDKIFLVGLTCLLEQFGPKKKEAYSLFASITDKLDCTDEYSRYLLLIRGFAQIELGRFYPAMKTLDSIAPESAESKLDKEILYQAGLLYERVGNNEEFASRFQMIKDIDPEYKDVSKKLDKSNSKWFIY